MPLFWELTYRSDASTDFRNVAWAEAYLRTKWHLVCPAVWPQYTKQTGHDRQDNVPIALSEPFCKRSPKKFQLYIFHPVAQKPPVDGCAPNLAQL